MTQDLKDGIEQYMRGKEPPVLAIGGRKSLMVANILLDLGVDFSAFMVKTSRMSKDIIEFYDGIIAKLEELGVHVEVQYVECEKTPNRACGTCPAFQEQIKTRNGMMLATYHDYYPGKHIALFHEIGVGKQEATRKAHEIKGQLKITDDLAICCDSPLCDFINPSSLRSGYKNVRKDSEC